MIWTTQVHLYVNINMVSVFSFSYNFPNNILFYCKNLVYNTHYIKICIIQLFRLSVRLLVNSWPLVVTFLGSQKLYPTFLPFGGSASLTSASSIVYLFLEICIYTHTYTNIYVWWFLTKLSIHLLYDPEIILLVFTKKSWELTASQKPTHGCL